MKTESKRVWGEGEVICFQNVSDVCFTLWLFSVTKVLSSWFGIRGPVYLNFGAPQSPVTCSIPWWSRLPILLQRRKSFFPAILDSILGSLQIKLTKDELTRRKYSFYSYLFAGWVHRKEAHTWSGSAQRCGLIRCSRWLCIHAGGVRLTCKVHVFDGDKWITNWVWNRYWTHICWNNCHSKDKKQKNVTDYIKLL